MFEGIELTGQSENKEPTFLPECKTCLQVAEPGAIVTAMKHIRPLCLTCLLSLSAATPGAATTEFRLGGDEGTTWEDARSPEGGAVYLVTDAAGQILREVAVAPSPFDVGADTLIDFADRSLAPRFIDPSVNLALTDLDSKDFNLSLPWSGGTVDITNLCCCERSQTIAVMKAMHDGDPRTAMFRGFTQDPERAPGFGEGYASLRQPSSMVLDFASEIPINRIRFYPRLGQEEDRLLIDEFQDPTPEMAAFGQDSFAGNFLAWFDIQVGDDTPVYRRGMCDVSVLTNDLPWLRPTDPFLDMLKSTRENLDTVVDLRFPTRSIRWINLRPVPLRDWEIAELEVYGEGYVERTVYTTQILDFGRPVNWGKLRWRGELPEDTRIEIRTRTGSTDDPNVYLADNTNGDLRPVTYTEYIRTDVSGRLQPAYDSQHWSFWSSPYEFQAGQRDEQLPATAWLDGTPMLSPGPSRFVQIDIRLFSTFTAAPRLDELSIQLAEAPSAREVIGEIWPIETDTFDPVSFTYVVAPVFEAEDVGFDRLEILTPTRVTTLPVVRLNGTEVDQTAYPTQVEDDRIVVSFPQLLGPEDSFKQVEVVFDASVLRFGTEFRSWVYNSAETDPVRQRVEPGNATFRFSGDGLSVSTPIGGALLRQVEAEPSVFTPNGDGHNDVLTFAFKLREVATPSPIRFKLFDLGGNLVHELPSMFVQSGQFEQAWDGRDWYGRLLAPGTYVYEVTLHAEQQEKKLGSFAIAY